MKRVVFSSDNLPPGLGDDARLKRWHEIFAGAIGSFDTSRLPDRPFFARSELIAFDQVVLARYAGTMRDMRLTRRQAAASPVEGYQFSFNTGPSRFRRIQRENDSVIATGDATFQSTIEAVTVTTDAPSEWLGVMMASDAIRELVPAADDLVATAFDRDIPVVGYLRRYIATLLDIDGLADEPLLLDHVGTTLVDLVVLALGAKGDAAAIAHMRGMRAARARLILAEIKKGFADPAFSPRRLAAGLGLTANYVQKLLHETGLSFTERTLELRLRKARAMLADPQHRGRRIGEIAYACGFNEVSYFNRCFRRRFGASPTQYRGGDTTI